MTLTSYVDADLSRGYFTSDQLPANVHEEAAEDGTSIWSLTTHVGSG